MAVVNPTITWLGGDRSVMKVVWSAMANGDTGAPISFIDWADRSVQVAGTFGTGGSLRWAGSNDETNYVALTDPQGNDLNFTTAKIEAVTEISAIARPHVTAGDGTTSLTVTAILRRPQPLRQ